VKRQPRRHEEHEDLTKQRSVGNYPLDKRDAEEEGETAMKTIAVMSLALFAASALAGASQTPQVRDKYKFSETSPELERRDQPVTEEDLRILKRADSLLSTAAAWNRHDTRNCKPKATTWSLFCVMEKASEDVLGHLGYRAVALQEVRFVVEDAMRGSKTPFVHRLTDYNNLPSTRFDDIKNVLKIATDRVSARLISQQTNKGK
jgi:hypothetical protein